MFPDFSSRAPIHELMDAPGCCETKLLRTVRQFATINRLVARYRTTLKQRVIADMLREPAREYHLVDMGAGGCDIDVWLLKAAQRKDLSLRITACDTDPRIIAYAESKHGTVEGLTILNRDLLSGSIDSPADYVFANHFLHHLTNEQIIHLLRKWSPFVKRQMIFSDLHRTRLAYAGYAAFSTFFPRSFARTDGLISIRRGFIPDELAALVKQALPGGECSIQQYIPGRLALCIGGSDTTSLSTKE